mmetsp:Transcript_7666/g.11722  ORF Transcript_7666/g.11722 Transcript_7666/m.11722 type:complete len:307 (+) Transcript_7666:60-980(+)
MMKYNKNNLPSDDLKSHNIKSSDHLNKTTKETPLRIQVVSDLHIEFYNQEQPPPNFLIEPCAPILALLGDIGLACTDQLRTFLLSQCDRFEHVLFVAGNHEYYNKGETVFSMTEQLEWMEGVCSERSNLHFMDNKSITLNGILILGTTLWSDIPDESLWQAQISMNDYNLSYNHQPKENESPRKLTAHETRNIHRKSVAWLRSCLTEAKKQNNQRVVILTHHTPLLAGTSHPRYNGNELNCCFSTNLKTILVSYDNIVAWACGHTHYNFDFRVGNNVRIVSNQRGYKDRPNKSYDRKGVVIEAFPN